MKAAQNAGQRDEVRERIQVLFDKLQKSTFVAEMIGRWIRQGTGLTLGSTRM
jgi:hypothetical protein